MIIFQKNWDKITVKNFSLLIRLASVYIDKIMKWTSKNSKKQLASYKAIFAYGELNFQLVFEN